MVLWDWKITIIVILVVLWLLKKYINSPYTPYSRDLSGQVVIVTGSSAGTGKETAKSLLKHGATVVFANRNEEKTNKVISGFVEELGQQIRKRAIFIPINLSSFKSVINFTKQFNQQFDKLDMLINNAGAANPFFTLTEDNIELTWQADHLSHVLLTSLLLNKISNSEDGRIINVSSEVHGMVSKREDYFEFKPSNYFQFTSLAAAKAGNILMTEVIKNYTEDSKIRNLKTACLNPGLVNTEAKYNVAQNFILKVLLYVLIIPLSFLFFKSEESGAQTILHLCYMDKNEFVNGGYYENCKPRSLYKALNDEDFRKRANKSTYDLITGSDAFKSNLKEEEKNLMLFKYLKQSF